MVLLLYLWENVRKWGSFEAFETFEPEEEPKEPYTSVDCERSVPIKIEQSPESDQFSYQQMGGLRRLDTSAIRTHFYPEGGWGWIVCACAFLAHVTTSGAQLSAGALHIVLANKFQDSTAHHWLGPLSWSVSSVFSPLVVNLCRRKNVRILSLIGGILFPLSLLCTSFATELHQIFFSFGLIGGIGSCMVRESSGVVLGEFFRKRRQFVEQVVMAGTGVGVTLFSLLYLSFTRHLEWGVGFRVGAAFCTICILLPAFYRTAAQYQPSSRGGSGGQSLLKTQRVESPKSPSSILVPIGGDICRSLNLFCVPSLKPVLWSAAFSSFGLYAPVFLMSDFGRSEGLSGGSLLLLQTHLGLGLSLGVILGAILTLKKFRCCQLSPRMLCCSTACLTGLSMIAISSVKGYYGYSLSAWVYGVALGSHLYTLKILTMELTRTKHWSRIWSCVQSLMSPGILLGTGLTSYLGKPGFYACATCVLIAAGLIGFQLIDLTKCGSPQLSSSVDNDSPIPPAPPPISLSKYGHGHHATPVLGAVADHHGPPGFYPLRRSISLQQPIYPCCRDATAPGPEFGLGAGIGGQFYGYPPGYSPYCRECVLSSPLPPYPMSMLSYYHPTPPGTMIRSYSLPQTGPGPSPNAHLKTTGTQTNPNSPTRKSGQMYPGSYDRLPTLPGSFLPQDRVIRDGDDKKFRISTNTNGNAVPTTTANTSSSYKNTVMFASNPQLFPASATQSSATSTTDRSATPTSHYSHNHHHHRHHNNHSPRTSPRSYYPRREERRANFIKSHQRSFDSQQLDEPEPPQKQRHYPTSVVTVETHKKPGETSTTPKPQEKVDHQRQPPAFTRHYFDSSKIQKGTGKSVVHGILSTSSQHSGLANTSGQGTSQQNAQPFRPEQTLPISQINAKLQQYQRQQQQQQQQEVNWRNIQRQTSTPNPFDNDPDPPYYPAALSHAQTHAYARRNPPAKVSESEFDVEQPKFNSLRRIVPKSTHNSSISSQLNYSVTPTPLHHQSHHHHGHHLSQQQGSGYNSNYHLSQQHFHPHPNPQHQHQHQHQHHHGQTSQYQNQNQNQQRTDRRQGNGNTNSNTNGNINSGNVSNANVRGDDCPYCDPRNVPPPLSLSVPALQQSDPHYMCHYGWQGGGGPPFLRRRNTWHHHRDQLEAITTSV